MLFDKLIVIDDNASSRCVMFKRGIFCSKRAQHLLLYLPPAAAMQHSIYSLTVFFFTSVKLRYIVADRR
jgi:hypothetical protein